MPIEKKSVYFLFINGPHHVYHLIEPALRFASTKKDYASVFISGNPVNTSIIINSQRQSPLAEFELVDIPLPFRYRFIKSYKSKKYPPVYTRIPKIISRIEDATAIVGTSHDIPKIIDEYKIRGPKLFYLYHGTGTREYGFDSAFDGFDYILAPGPYHRDRLIKENICDKNKIVMTGQPKFDWITKHHQSDKKLFNNDNPIFYYNPHWDMSLSSYLEWRSFILEFFRQNSDYNLIFSPHPLVKHLSKKRKYAIEIESETADNIIIDLDSNKQINGTYNAVADVYIGDVSSVVTEWINYRPRPCIFINAHKVKWNENKSYEMWNYGTVVDDNRDFRKVVSDSLKNDEYHERQLRHGEKFIFMSDRNASEICSDFIFDKLDFGNN